MDEARKRWGFFFTEFSEFLRYMQKTYDKKIHTMRYKNSQNMLKTDG